MKIVPPKANWEMAIKDGIKGGLAGGLPTGVLFWLTQSPFWSQLIGGIVGGAIVGGEVGRIVTVNGVMDAVVSMFISRG